MVAHFAKLSQDAYRFIPFLDIYVRKHMYARAFEKGKSPKEYAVAFPKEIELFFNVSTYIHTYTKTLRSQVLFILGAGDKLCKGIGTKAAEREYIFTRRN